ncbi:MAG: aspartate/glutamate racemase family protein [Leptothrix sp. (in: b-proteobacteria)]
MNLLIVNPNTSSAMTAGIAAAARLVAAPGTQLIATQPSFGPLSIEGHYDEAFATAGVAEQVRLHAGPGTPGDLDADATTRISGVVIACFGDPGLDAAREATRAPVIGVAEAAFHAASLVSTGFSVVTTMTRTCVIAEHLLHKYGFERRCRGVHGTDIPVLALEDGGAGCLDLIEAAAREALSRDRSGAIVLGCAGMAALCDTLSARLGVPVIDGVAAAVKLAEALAGLNLRTSKRGDYAQPLPKVYTGWAAPLGW